MTKTEIIKHNEKKLVNEAIKLESKLEHILSNDFICKINKLDIDEQFREELLFSVAEIKRISKAQSDVMRLAYMIFFYKNLKPELKERYTKGIKKALCDVLYESVNKEESTNVSFFDYTE